MRGRSLLLLVTAVTWASSACGSVPPATRQAVPILGAAAGSDPLSLRLTIAACGGQPTARVSESPADVRVVVTARAGGPDQSACADSVTIVLARPLGHRTLTDGAVNRPVGPPR